MFHVRIRWIIKRYFVERAVLVVCIVTHVLGAERLFILWSASHVFSLDQSFFIEEMVREDPSNPVPFKADRSPIVILAYSPQREATIVSRQSLRGAIYARLVLVVLNDERWRTIYVVTLCARHANINQLRVETLSPFLLLSILRQAVWNK